jgi:hypothetical protein
MKPHFPAYELVKNGEISENSFEKLKPGKYKYPSLVECEEVFFCVYCIWLQKPKG